MAKCSNLSILRWLFAILLLICCIFLIIGLGTSHWIHYTDGTSIYEYGLWRFCKFTSSVIEACNDVERAAAPLIALHDQAIRVLLIVSVVFCVIGVVLLFLILNNCLREMSVMFLILCMFVAMILAWGGVGTFINLVEKNASTSAMSYEWSFILACFATVLLTVLFLLSICYANCEKEKRKRAREGDVEYMKKAKSADNGVNGHGVVNAAADVPEVKVVPDARVYVDADADVSIKCIDCYLVRLSLINILYIWPELPICALNNFAIAPFLFLINFDRKSIEFFF